MIFLLSEQSGRIPSEGDSYGFEVLENKGDRQIIEVMYPNTSRSWSRYVAFSDRIERLSYRTDGSFLVLLPLLFLLTIAFYSGKGTARALKRTFGMNGSIQRQNHRREEDAR